jgi:tRNA threonylcarbamoyladenosine biosynthesis protein TsaB
MRILALETTDKTGSVAALCDTNLLAELTLDHRQRSAQSLAPAIQTLLNQLGWLPSNVQLVAVSVGPGSFTGLRVGVTTAKVFAYAVGADVLGIDTLQAIATAAPPETPILWAAMDAQRDEVVAQCFGPAAAGRRPSVTPQQLMPIDTWLAHLTPGVAVTGPVLEKLLDRLPSGVEVLDRRYWTARAAAVGCLAARYYAEGRRDDLLKLVPHYCRRSAAEEKWDASRANAGIAGTG